ncbi:glyoxalase superfamily protein [Hyphomonas sp.]|uniref:glyoxalase superfamily protein n=1 Tax=Hyphomonas sp. TaxID=87 RepID=UPI00391A6D2E
MKTPVTNRDQAKARARELRAELAASGSPVSHAEALERVAGELGYRDWNTASARLSNEPDVPLQVGDRVAGRYLKQAFTGRVLGVREVAGGAAFEVTIRFDAPVDVVEFESFSNLRTQVQITVSAGGVSAFKTSDGAPHMVVERTSAGIV